MCYLYFSMEKLSIGPSDIFLIYKGDFLFPVCKDSEKGPTLKGKKGSKFFLFRVDPFPERTPEK